MDNNDISHLVDYTFTLHINTCYVSYDESEVMILIYIYWWYLKIMKKTHQHENHKTRSFRHFQSTMAFRGFPWRQLRCWRFGQSMAAGSRHVLLQSSSFVGPAIGCQHRIPAKKNQRDGGAPRGLRDGEVLVPWGWTKSIKMDFDD